MLSEIGIVVTRTSHLDSGIVVHLGIHTLHKLGDGQFDKLRMQQLLLRDALCQPLLLCEMLYLYLILCHCYLKY